MKVRDGGGGDKGSAVMGGGGACVVSVGVSEGLLQDPQGYSRALERPLIQFPIMYIYSYIYIIYMYISL